MGISFEDGDTSGRRGLLWSYCLRISLEVLSYLTRGVIKTTARGTALGLSPE